MPPFQGLYPLERLFSIVLSSRRDLKPDKVKSCDSIRERCREKNTIPNCGMSPFQGLHPAQKTIFYNNFIPSGFGTG